MEHPPKQGLKQQNAKDLALTFASFNGTSTKTRIETEENRKLKMERISF